MTAENQMDKELQAINQIIKALDSLDIDEKKRVLDYVFNRLGLKNIKVDQTPLRQDFYQPDLIPAINPNSSENFDSNFTKDIRSLKEEKNPSTAIQMVALVAYYLSEFAPPEEKKDTINSEDITKYFKQANFELPKGEPIYTLRNARNAGYFEPTSEAGVYKLNSVGYNLVAHKLPLNGKERIVRKKKIVKKKK